MSASLETALKFARGLNARAYFALGALYCLGLILMALYFQFQGGLEPCPLCISQRIMVVAVGLVMLAAALHNPGPAGVGRYAWLGFATALGGAAISARHIWIQHLPADKVPACTPGLEYMFHYFPLTDTLKAMVTGTGDCAKVDWTLLGLSMPAWVLICFLFLAALSLAQFWNRADRTAA
ncbi:disulfide bond formation protein B [Methylomagnum ishizawai]|uniref:disulfide bond formation protein B n=1 Tax=Methylomagnum ishizawai TaxID=1760988 RepID=UPI001C327700|nr:disulfide bond formation protein B [Methylomagnum ishizawai]BBL76927.1 disulfide bond formation protein B 1 [Methylomagnum ishizawai]